MLLFKFQNMFSSLCDRHDFPKKYVRKVLTRNTLCFHLGFDIMHLGTPVYSREMNACFETNEACAFVGVKFSSISVARYCVLVCLANNNGNQFWWQKNHQPERILFYFGQSIGRISIKRPEL